MKLSFVSVLLAALLANMTMAAESSGEHVDQELTGPEEATGSLRRKLFTLPTMSAIIGSNGGAVHYTSNPKFTLFSTHPGNADYDFWTEKVGNKYAIRCGRGGLYLSSENGRRPITCSRTKVGAWELFTVRQHSSGFSIQCNNGLLISSENGRKPISCNRPLKNANIKGSWEVFDIMDHRSATHLF